MEFAGGLRLPSVPQSVAHIRRYAKNAASSHGFGGNYDTLDLLVSELATNAPCTGWGTCTSE